MAVLGKLFQASHQVDGKIHIAWEMKVYLSRHDGKEQQISLQTTIHSKNTFCLLFLFYTQNCLKGHYVHYWSHISEERI